VTRGAVNLNSDVFVMTLVTSGYTPLPDTHSTWSSASAQELPTANGYTAGGIVLTSVSDSLSGATVSWTSAQVSWPSAVFSCKYAIIVRRAGGALAGTDLLISFADLNSGAGSITAQGGSFILSPSGSWLTFAHSP